MVEDNALLEARKIVKAINEKLEAKLAIIAESLAHGQVTWRRTSTGKLVISIKPDIE